MITINANTKIAALLKAHPDALKAIISISPKFNKLQNPLLRKIMASRTSIAMASKVAGCTPNDFFEKLEPLGFAIDKDVAVEEETIRHDVPEFMHQFNEKNLETLDVRPVIESGKDPFNIIMKQIKELQPGNILKLVNTFEPAPLITILSKQGFEYFVENEHENAVNTFFYKKDAGADISKPQAGNAADWDEVLKRFENSLITVDVRHLEMPQPMITILDALEKLPDTRALFVHHKRIPVFLLPELEERKFAYRINEISDGNVQMLIFRNL